MVLSDVMQPFRRESWHGQRHARSRHRLKYSDTRNLENGFIEWCWVTAGTSDIRISGLSRVKRWYKELIIIEDFSRLRLKSNRFTLDAYFGCYVLQA